MTHDRCSELLRGYVRNELPRELADEVRAHLAACDACRAEERAVATMAVTGGGDARPLDDMERARLHRGLAQELFTAGTSAAPAATAAGRWGRWVVPAATAAAVLAGVLVMTLGGGLDEDVPESAAVQDVNEDAGGSGEADGGRGADDSTASTDRASNKAGTETSRALSAQAGSGGGGAQVEFGAPGDPVPVFDADRGELTTARLTNIGRGDHFRRFALSYRPKDASGLYDGFLDLIASEAEELAPEIEECAATVPQDPLIPAYATTGEYRGSRVLVLGFVASDYGARLNRVLVWAWELGDCDEPVETLFLKIGRR